MTHVAEDPVWDAWITALVSLAPLITGLKLQCCREMTDERMGALAALTGLASR
jgi:hypothetical protein